MRSRRIATCLSRSGMSTDASPKQTTTGPNAVGQKPPFAQQAAPASASHHRCSPRRFGWRLSLQRPSVWTGGFFLSAERIYVSNSSSALKARARPTRATASAPVSARPSGASTFNAATSSLSSSKDGRNGTPAPAKPARLRSGKQRAHAAPCSAMNATGSDAAGHHRSNASRRSARRQSSFELSAHS